MMLFEQLWNGSITPYKYCGQGDPEVEELAELVERNKASLNHALTEEQQELLKNYTVCREEYSYLLIVHAFRQGFSLASRLLAEAFSEDVKVIPPR